MNPLKLEIRSAEIREPKGISKSTGKPYHLREQSGYIDLGKAYPEEVRFLLRADQAPLVPGDYMVEATCFYVNRKGNLSVALERAMRVHKPAKSVAA